MELKFPKLESIYISLKKFFKPRLALCLWFLLSSWKETETKFLGLYTMSFLQILCRFLKWLVALGMSGPELLLQWLFFFALPFFLKKIFIFNGRIIALQNSVIFCQTSTWISHRYTYVPSLLNLPSISLPTLPLLVDTEPLCEFPEPTANSHWLSIVHMVM